MDRHNSRNTSSNVMIFRKFIPITIVLILTLIQGLLGIGCLVMLYIFYDCKPSYIHLGMILFFKYFGGDKCDSSTANSDATTPESASADIPASQYVESSISTYSTMTSEEFNTYLPEVISVAKRIQIELIMYGVISILWIFTSFLTLVSCLCKYVGKTPFYVCFVPWFTVVIAGCILDLVAMILHIRDITHTRTIKETLGYLEIEKIQPLLEVKNYSNDYLYVPIIVTCITSKLFILWIINLFGSFLVIKQSKIIVYNRKLRPSLNEFEINRESAYEPTGVTRKSNEMKEVTRELDETKEKANDSELAPNRSSYENSKITVTNPYDRQSVNLRRLTSTISNQTNEVSLGPRDKNNRDSDSLSRLSLSSSVSRVQSMKEKLHVTEELRSQLPWSYLNARNDMSTSIRVLAHHEHNDVLPPVPVPDYDANFHRQENQPHSRGSRVTHRSTLQHP